MSNKSYSKVEGGRGMQEIDVNNLTVIGKGAHGTVYRLDDKRCIKVCKNEKHMQMEFAVLKHSERFPHFPRVYECKGNYMIREYFDGPNAREYIQKNGLSTSLCDKLIEIIDIFKELGYTRLDCRFSHIIIIDGEQLKIIDPTRNMDKTADYPIKLLKGLEEFGYKEKFLSRVKEVRPEYYQAWKDK
jgi:predicted Ser/Thr protein kinase